MNDKLKILSIVIVGLMGLILSPWPKLEGMENFALKRGLVKFNFNKEAVWIGSSAKDSGVTYCSVIKRECLKYRYAFTKPPASPKPEEQKCLEKGCLVWGNPETKKVTLELSSQQISSLINDYAPLPTIKQVKVSFKEGRFYAQALSFWPLLPGKIKIAGEKKGHRKVKINTLYVGAINLTASPLKDLIEKKLNTLLGYRWQGSWLEDFDFKEGGIVLKLWIAPVLIKDIFSSF